MAGRAHQGQRIGLTDPLATLSLLENDPALPSIRTETQTLCCEALTPSEGVEPIAAGP